MRKDTKYYQYPIGYQKRIYTEPKKVAADIIGVGIYKYALSVTGFTPEQVARQVLYSWNQHDQNLPTEISDFLELAGMVQDEDYHGFVNGKFDPEQINDVIAIFEKEPDLYNVCAGFYRVHSAENYFRSMRLLDVPISDGEQLYNDVPENEPWAMLSADQVLDIYEGKVTGFDLHCMAASAGIRSVIGVRQFAKSNNGMMIARMMGYKSHAAMTADTLTPDVKELAAKYSTRYWSDKIMRRLETKFGLVKYSYFTRGFYVGVVGRITIETLVEIIEGRKEKNIYDALKERKKAARIKTQQHLKSKEQHLKSDEAGDNKGVFLEFTTNSTSNIGHLKSL